MPLKTLKYQKSDKPQLVFYADIECLIEKIEGCKSNLENSFAAIVR